MLIAKQASFLELPNQSKSNQKHPPYHEQLARANKDVADIDAGADKHTLHVMAQSDEAHASW